MDVNRIAVIGTIVDNLTMDETVKKVFKMVDRFKDDGHPRQLATLNVDFLVNAHSWRPDHPRHPELLNILRHADIVTADGMPILWTSKLMGFPLKERVTGADLVPRLAEEAARTGKSIYFLGGTGDSGRKAANVLQNLYPGLKIAGIDASHVSTSGEGIMNSMHQDKRIVDDINRSRADILLIGFGNPKQEIWFALNRKRLEIPVAIGIGGSFGFISGSVKRAPQFIQKAGMEWLFRISQDPARLWKRYFTGIFRFIHMAVPAILYYKYRMIYDRFFTPKKGAAFFDCRITHNKIILIKLPGRLEQSSIAQLDDKIKSLTVSNMDLILDLSYTSFIDPWGLGYLVTLLAERNKTQYSLHLTGVSKSVKRILKINRLWDALKHITHSNPDEAIKIIKQRPSRPNLEIVSNFTPESLRIEFCGRLDSESTLGLDASSFIKDIGNRDCYLNLRELEFIDSSGLIFLLKIRKLLAGNNRVPVLCGISKNISQMLRISSIEPLFQLAPDTIKY
jgi:N-acetylglucosaminyldiphosphoundecaprenol N-acetyl-beta-D-mannosaminyltransferase